ncbi:MAG: TIGR03618 family F420-dependent PPOX class oxidoreductase [Actinobacteria bacterium]|nr:TIGR03618 family F420-dependent PPOX class oxidoreductase [Actinomycetota bacterium]
MHLATLMPDGSPHSIPVWGIVEGGRIGFFTVNPKSRKALNVVRDPRVALSVVDESNPYRSAHVRGRVVEVAEGDEAQAAIDRMSERYVGSPFPVHGGFVYWIEPETTHVVELPFRH